MPAIRRAVVKPIPLAAPVTIPTLGIDARPFLELPADCRTPRCGGRAADPDPVSWLASKLYRVRARYHRRSGTPCALRGIGTCRMAAP